MAAMFAWFTGGYVSSMLRSEIKGQDRTDEEHLENAMYSMPIIGAMPALWQSVTMGPAMMSTMSDVNDAMLSTVETIKD